MVGKLRRDVLLLALGLLLSVVAKGQATITTRLSRDSALLGDTVGYSVMARGGGGAEIFFVELPDTIAGGGELWEAPRIDTLVNSAQEVALRLHMVVTCYDSGTVVLPRFGVLVRHAGVLDTLFSEPKDLYFYPAPREAETADIKDIRGPLRQRITFGEVWPWLLGVLVLAALIVGVVMYRRYMRKGEIVEAKRRLVPPDELALDRLRRLREGEAWRTLGLKEFYTELTDTLREFLAAEFGIRTMECTTTKIVNDLRSDSRCKREWIKEIDGILQLADLTKFARFAPTEQDCLYSIGTTEVLVREVHAVLHAGEREEDEDAEGEGATQPEPGDAARGTESEEEKAQRNAERYGPRRGEGVSSTPLERREE